ncbi:hypothetical protein TorRG33x02_116580, partial [Trema orientale]
PNCFGHRTDLDVPKYKCRRLTSFLISIGRLTAQSSNFKVCKLNKLHSVFGNFFSCPLCDRLRYLKSINSSTSFGSFEKEQWLKFKVLRHVSFDNKSHLMEPKFPTESVRKFLFP